MAQPCRLIEISGSPYERGVQYGRQGAEEIFRAVARYSKQIKAKNVSDDRLADIVPTYMPIIENFDDRHVAEMRGTRRVPGSASNRSYWSMRGPNWSSSRFGPRFSIGWTAALVSSSGRKRHAMGI
jgi:hypothetical protein